jgi:hypothetical protein
MESVPRETLQDAIAYLIEIKEGQISNLQKRLSPEEEVKKSPWISIKLIQDAEGCRRMQGSFSNNPGL